MTRICSVYRIFQTNCKNFMLAKEKKNRKQNEICHLVDPRTKQRKQSLNSRILKCVNCINWELEFSMRFTMSSLNIYFSFYRNSEFYYKSLKHTSFSAWFKNINFLRRDNYRNVYKEWLKFRQ